MSHLSDEEPDPPRQRDGEHQQAAEQNLMFALFALQMNFISREDLLSASQRWLADKSARLDRILVEQGMLRSETRDALSVLIQQRLDRDRRAEVEPSLMSSLDGCLQDELRKLGDADINDSLDRWSRRRARQEDPEPTLPLPANRGGLPRYRILRPHAKGGLGEVFVAHDDELRRQVALKEMQAAVADDPQFRERFVWEAEITGRLEHPGIVPVYGLGHYADGRPYYAMRFVRGDSLRRRIAEFHQADQQAPLRSERAVEFRNLLGRLIDVCHAVHYAHTRGVLHRDLKPGNIMLGKHGETLVVDWGLAKPLDAPADESSDEESVLTAAPDARVARTEMGSVHGTPEFMSPEQAEGRMDLLGPASDVYSLGATLYMILTGRSAFESRRPTRQERVQEMLQHVRRGEFPRPTEIAPRIPQPLESICLQAMARDPAQRHATARLLAEDLERWLADEPLAQLQAAVAYFRGELEAAPTTSEYAERLARELTTLSAVQAAAGRRLESIAAAREAVETLQRINPVPEQRRTALRQELFYARSQLIRALQAAGRTAEADDLRRAERAELEQWIQTQADSEAARREYISMTLQRGWTLKQIEERLDQLPPSAPATPPEEDPLTEGTLHQGTVHPGELDQEMARPTPLLDPGEDRYEILGTIAWGGMAHIVRAFDRSIRRQVAIKLVRPRHADVASLLLDELRLLGQLLHPHIVPVLSSGQTAEGDLYFSMPLFEEDLGARIRERPADFKPWLPAFARICEAVHYANERGVIHGDAKPANIALSGEFPVLIDWGLATRRANFEAAQPIRDWSGMSIREGQVVGTPVFMSPEQIRGDSSSFQPATDVFVLGGTLYALLTGGPPQYGDGGQAGVADLLRRRIEDELKPRSPRGINPQVPRGLEKICEQALEPRPEDRFATPADLRDAVETWLRRWW